MQYKKLTKGLYVITDYQNFKFKDLLRKTELILQNGISVLQYRNKNSTGKQKKYEAAEFQKLCTEYNTCYIINDDIELANDIGADGVHLGQNDTSCVSARAQLGNQKIIGISCYNSLNRAEQAISNSADYIAFGAMYSTTTKKITKKAWPKLISIAKSKYSSPVVAIGGITPDNCHPLITENVDMLAVVSSVYLADNPSAVIKNFNRLIKNNEPL